MEELARRERAAQRGREKRLAEEERTRAAREREAEERDRRRQQRQAEAALEAAMLLPDLRSEAVRDDGAPPAAKRPRGATGAGVCAATDAAASAVVAPAAGGTAEAVTSPAKAAAAPREDPRTRVRQKMNEILQARERELRSDGTPARDTATLSGVLEAAIFEVHGLSRAYVVQSRAVTFNLGDPNNSTFVSRVLDGSIGAASLATMSSEEMASQTKSDERARSRNEAAEAATIGVDKQTISSEYTCESCQGTRTAYSQSMATESCVRSGGEPVMTAVTFVTCLGCHHRWTIRSGQA